MVSIDVHTINVLPYFTVITLDHISVIVCVSAETEYKNAITYYKTTVGNIKTKHKRSKHKIMNLLTT